jgi:hypothetical protein
MKTKPDFTGNLLTSQLQDLPDGTLFSEHVFDGLAKEPTIYKKIDTLKPYKDWPEGDITIEPICLGQFSEVPGERCRLGYTDESEKEWRVWSQENVEKMVGWLMTTHQYLSL